MERRDERRSFSSDRQMSGLMMPEGSRHGILRFCLQSEACSLLVGSWGGSGFNVEVHLELSSLHLAVQEGSSGSLRFCSEEGVLSRHLSAI